MDFIKEADIVVVGGGVVGCAILRELSRYNVKCVLLEKEPDIACGTTKANSAILHAGFDAPTGSMKAITNDFWATVCIISWKMSWTLILNGPVLWLLLLMMKKLKP